METDAMPGDFLNPEEQINLSPKSATKRKLRRAICVPVAVASSAST